MDAYGKEIFENDIQHDWSYDLWWSKFTNRYFGKKRIDFLFQLYFVKFYFNLEEFYFVKNLWNKKKNFK